jgi:hypothetical protein
VPVGKNREDTRMARVDGVGPELSRASGKIV